MLLIGPFRHICFLFSFLLAYQNSIGRRTFDALHGYDIGKLGHHNSDIKFEESQ